MSGNLKNCIDSAAAQGHITREEAEAYKKRYDQIARRVLSTGEAKKQLEAEIAAEASEKKRRSYLMETRRQALVSELTNYKNEDGSTDIATAFIHQHQHAREAYGGGKIDDAETLREVIMGRQVHGELESFLHEFRRGIVTGDLVRTSKTFGSKSMQARLDNVGREIVGQKTSDPVAAGFAKALSETADKLRLRFNEAGGAIGKLDYGWLPQHWNQEALVNYVELHGMEALLDHVIPHLDREKMLHPLTKRPMSNEELRTGAQVALSRAMTDGWIDKEVTGVPVGRGALATQHAEHRFFHFKDYDSWKKIATDFGTADIYQAFMGHYSTMARDIAHMEKFGPNPEVMRTYLKNLVRSSAEQMKPVAALIKEQTAQLKQLGEKLHIKNPDFVATIDRISKVHWEMMMIRKRWRPSESETSKPRVRDKLAIEKLTSELSSLENNLVSYRLGVKPDVIEDVTIKNEMKVILDRMRDPIVYADVDNPRAHAEHAIRRADGMWEIMRGSLTAPVESRIANSIRSFRDEPSLKRLGRIGTAVMMGPFTAAGQSTIRNIITSSTLGSAVISALSDPMLQSARRSFIGIKNSNSISVLHAMISQIGTENKREAVRSGLILDSALHVFHQQARYTGTIDTRSISGFLADRVISAQGLAAWTQMGKHAFGMDFQATMADHAKTAWADLPRALRDTLDYHNFDAKSWDEIRGAQLYEPRPGAVFLRPNEIDAVNPKLADRYLAMILRERANAIPEGTVRSRSVILGGTRPGTVAGELVRNFGQFKSFGVSTMTLHLAQVARDLGAGEGARGAKYAGTLFITGTLMGVMAMALKDIKDGRDPRRWLDKDTYVDPAVIGAALLQAGGMGIWGDFLFSNLNRNGNSLAATVAGPMIDRADNLRELTLGNVQQVLQGKKTHFGRELVKALRMNTPGGNLPFIGLAYQRMVIDQLQWMADPEAAQAFRKQVHQRQKDYHQGFWWSPGEATPRRAPDLGTPFRTN